LDGRRLILLPRHAPLESGEDAGSDGDERCVERSGEDDPPPPGFGQTPESRLEHDPEADAFGFRDLEGLRDAAEQVQADLQIRRLRGRQRDPLLALANEHLAVQAVLAVVQELDLKRVARDQVSSHFVPPWPAQLSSPAACLL